MAAMPLKILALFSAFFTVPYLCLGSVQRCPDVVLTAPSFSPPWEEIRVSAESSKSPVSGNWLITKENFRSEKVEVELIKDASSIDVRPWQTNDSGRLTVAIIVPASSACNQESLAATSVMLVENAGSPMIIDEFGLLGSRDRKARLDVVAAAMLERPDQKLFVFLGFPKSDSGAKRLKRMREFLEHLSSSRSIDAKRITFLLEETQQFRARFQPFPRDYWEPYGSNYLVINAERLSEYESLFR